MTEQEGYFFEPRSLIGRKEQTRQDIKIRRHDFCDKGVKKSAQCLSFPPDHFRLPGTEYCKPSTFAKRSLYFQGIYLFSFN